MEYEIDKVLCLKVPKINLNFTSLKPLCVVFDVVVIQSI